MRRLLPAVVALVLITTVVGTAPAPSTVVVILADDLDASLTPFADVMPNLRSTFQNNSAAFKNAFVTVPVCCPSRSSFMSGRYQHNNRCFRNSIAGGCSSPWFKQNIERNSTFAVALREAGWVTGFFGKYLNQYARDRQGVAHVPAGWSKWLGLRGNSVYYDYTLSDNGAPEKHGRNYETDYLVDLLANRSSSFLTDTFAQQPEASVLAFVSTPAAHSPYDPAPQYSSMFADAKAPRTPNWNRGQAGKHWLVGKHRVMQQGEINFSDLTYRRRLMTLKSLDQLISKVCAALKSADRFDNAYIFFTSDNGFHLGQFTMPDDKRLPYETDIRVPLLVKAPYPEHTTLTPAAEVSSIVLNIDLGPTLMHIAGIPTPEYMDGRSYLNLITPHADIATAEGIERHDFLVEYHGEFGKGSNGQYAPLVPPLFKTPPYFAGPVAAKMQDARNNTFSCLRTINLIEDSIFCDFYQTDATWQIGNSYFSEWYDLTRDPYQMNNSFASLPISKVDEMKKRLAALRRCKGATCV